MRENRPSGLMRGGKQTVIGYGLSIRRFLPTLHRASEFGVSVWVSVQILTKLGFSMVEVQQIRAA